MAENERAALNNCGKKSIHLGMLLYALLFPFISAAQISDTRFRRIGVEQGLSNSTINCAFQDSRGFIWFGTRDGLNRYDGAAVIIYRNKEHDTTSISDNFIRCITEDSKHNLWIGTSYGLNRFNPVTNIFTRYTYNKANNKSISSNIINAVYSFNAGNLLVGTVGGLELFNINTSQAKHFRYNANQNDCLGNDTVNCIFGDSYKRIWIGTQGGLNSLDQIKLTFKPCGDKKNSYHSGCKLTKREMA